MDSSLVVLLFVEFSFRIEIPLKVLLSNKIGLSLKVSLSSVELSKQFISLLFTESLTKFVNKYKGGSVLKIIGDEKWYIEDIP